MTDRVRRGLVALGVGLLLGLTALPGLAAEEGYATWYGPGFHGRRMANGQIFDMYDPTTTAANIFPFGTWLKVTNPANGRSVVVQVRDRGAFRHALDLSYAAFAQIADPRLMMIRVLYEVVSGPEGTPVERPQPASRGGERPAAPPAEHTVAPGETLWAIAVRYGLRPADLAAWNGLESPDLLRPGQRLRLRPATPAPAAEAETYTVQPGDTLSALAQRWGTTIEAIVQANGLSDPGLIVVGQTLRRPGAGAPASATTYTVQPGDTLWGIARRFDTTVEQLQALNSLPTPDLLQPGMVLRLR